MRLHSASASFQHQLSFTGMEKAGHHTDILYITVFSYLPSAHKRNSHGPPLCSQIVEHRFVPIQAASSSANTAVPSTTSASVLFALRNTGFCSVPH